MEKIDKVGILDLTIDNIHAEDGYAYLRKQLIGQQFEASLTLTSTGHPGWYTVVGRFKEKLGIPIIDDATDERPIVITMAHYSL